MRWALSELVKNMQFLHTITTLLNSSNIWMCGCVFVWFFFFVAQKWAITHDGHEIMSLIFFSFCRRRVHSIGSVSVSLVRYVSVPFHVSLLWLAFMWSRRATFRLELRINKQFICVIALSLNILSSLKYNLMYRYRADHFLLLLLLLCI